MKVQLFNLKLIRFLKVWPIYKLVQRSTAYPITRNRSSQLNKYVIEMHLNNTTTLLCQQNIFKNLNHTIYFLFNCFLLFLVVSLSSPFFISFTLFLHFFYFFTMHHILLLKIKPYKVILNRWKKKRKKERKSLVLKQ